MYNDKDMCESVQALLRCGPQNFSTEGMRIAQESVQNEYTKFICLVLILSKKFVDERAIEGFTRCSWDLNGVLIPSKEAVGFTNYPVHNHPPLCFTMS